MPVEYGGVGNSKVSRLNLTAILVGLSLAIIAIFIALGIAQVREQSREAADMERHTFRVLLQVQTLSEALQKAETGSRGYLLTNDRQFLDTFNQGSKALPEELAQLRRLTRDNEAQQENIGELALVLGQRLQRLRQGIELSVSGDQQGAISLLKPGQGFASMRNTQDLLDKIGQNERSLLKKRSEDYAKAGTKADRLLVALLLLMVIISVFAFKNAIAANRARERAVMLETEQLLLARLHDADAAAMRAAALVSAIGDATPDLIFAKDRKGRMTYANPSTVSLIGKPIDELLGLTTTEFSSVADQSGAIDETDARIMASGVGEVVDETFTNQAGKTFTFRSTKSPLRGPDGDIIGIAGVSVDVTADRYAAAALKDSEERFRTLSETAPSFIFTTNDEGEVTYTNRAYQDYTGLSNEALCGMGWLRTVHRDDRHIPEAAWIEAKASETGFSANYRFRSKDGEYRCFSVRARPVRAGAGQARQWIGTANDIQDSTDARHAVEAEVTERTAELAAALSSLQVEVDERERAEAQIRQMQKIESIGQLTGGIAHDFNNMLAVVLGSLEIVKRRLTSDPDKAFSAAENAEEGAKRAAQLTARLLAFSRQSPLAPEAVDANSLVSGMSELLRSTIGEQVQIETVLAGGLWKCFIDAPQLENAIVNLCVNARDAMPDGGKLTIETHNCHLDDQYASQNAEVIAGQFVLVSVSDSGSGMPADVIERAFDPFFTTKGVGKGTGLGLSQVHGFVRQSGGHIKIYSEESAGTTVKLYLPRYIGNSATATASITKPNTELPVAVEGETVLVVEDEAQVRRVSVEQLRDLNYTVLDVASAEEALEVLEKAERVDLIFTDIVMPGMSGRALADTVAASGNNVRVLYTTGYTRNAVVHNGTLDPGTEFIAKPYTASALAQKVRAVLDRR